MICLIHSSEARKVSDNLTDGKCDMPYKFSQNANHEDLSCGRVIYHKAGFTNYPVRLVCEIFERCLHIISEPNKKVCVYDPCCGGGYILTVLGFLYGERIESLYGSDISLEAIGITEQNMGLLTYKGLHNRKEQLKSLYETYGKDSHCQAIKSADNLLELIRHTISTNVFVRDILNRNGIIANHSFTADIIISDVPYGNNVSWSNDNPFAIDAMLDNLSDNLSKNAVIAVSSDKRQKMANHRYKRIEKFIVGKRKVEILRKILLNIDM